MVDFMSFPSSHEQSLDDENATYEYGESSEKKQKLGSHDVKFDF